MKFLIDTHALIWVLTENPKLGRKARAAIDKAIIEESLYVSVMSFWEIERKKTDGKMQPLKHVSAIELTSSDVGITDIPVSASIAIRAAGLRVNKDPIDAIIVATAITHDLTLITADAAILGWKGRLKRLDASV